MPVSHKSVSQRPTFATIATDPLRNFKFHVQIHHPKLVHRFPQLGFMSVSGLSITTDVVVYRQGGHNTTTQKMPGQSDFSPITMSRGLIPGDSKIHEWLQQIFMVIQGTGGTDGSQDFRARMDIMLIDHPVTTEPATVKAVWRVYNAWPTALSWGDLDAGANGVAIQQITFAHEGFEFKVAEVGGNKDSAAVITRK